jgi:hypothetical protein
MRKRAEGNRWRPGLDPESSRELYKRYKAVGATLTHQEFPTIEKHEIKTAVKAAPADKAPGEDTIPNGLWHKAIQVPEVIDRI